MVWMDDSYWFAWVPDFGWCACSFAGDTQQETLDGLQNSFDSICEYFIKVNKPIPEPVYPKGLFN